MKKKVLLSFFVLLTVLVLASCGNASNTQGSGNNENHEVHVYTLSDWVSNDTKHWHTCSECNAILDSEDHGFTMEKIDPTCDATGTITYTCGVCGYTKTTTIEKLQHAINLIEYIDETDESNPCIHHHVGVGTCEICQHEVQISKTDYESHDFKAKIVTEATCTTKGKLRYECAHCNEVKEEEYENKDAHVWNEGTKNGNIVTYTCKNCNATKQEIDASDAIEATVVKSDLLNTAVALEKATIKLDEKTLSGIGEANNVSIKADTVDVQTLTISDSIKTKIGDNEVFDFSMEADGNKVSEFNGMVTVTIPYTLKETDDPEAIAIWYLDENGEPESIEAKYSNGYVTFETSHFSLYVVIQMSAQDACDLFGHHYEVINRVNSTCKVPGYVLNKCSRCNDVITEELELAAHNWVLIDNIAPTLTAPGFKVYQCSVCNEIKTVELPKQSNNEDSRIAKVIKGILNLIKTDGIEVSYEAIQNNGLGKHTGTAIMIYNGNTQYQYEITERGYSVNKINVDTKKATTYSIYDNYITTNETDIPNESIKMLEVLYGENSSVTDILTNYFDTALVNTWTEKIINLVFDVNEENGTIAYTLNAEKALAVYEDIQTLTVQQFIDKYIDPIGYISIVQFVTKAKDMTIDEALKEIGSKGIDFDGLIEFILSYSEAFGMSQGSNGPTPKEIKAMIEQYRAVKITELIAQLSNNQMTYDQILQLVNQFGAIPVMQLIAQIGPKQSAAVPAEVPASMMPSVEELAQMLEGINLSFTFDNNYALKEVNFEGIAMIDNSMANITTTIKPAENAMSVVGEAEEAAKQEFAKYTVSADTNWLQDAFNKAFKTNLRFNYSERNGSIVIRTSPIYLAKLREITNITDLYIDYYNLPTNTESFYFVFDINNRYPSVSNIDGTGMKSINLTGRLTIYANTPNGPVFVKDAYVGQLFNDVIYTSNPEGYYLTQNYVGHSNIVSLVTEDEIKDKNVYNYDYKSNAIEKLVKEGKLIPETIYYKTTNLSNGESSYYSVPVYYYLENGTKYYLHDSYANYSIYTFPYLFEYNSTNIHISYYYDGSKLNMEFDSYLFAEYDKQTGELIYKNIVSKDGLFKFEYQSDSTQKAIHYKLTLNGQSYDLYDYNFYSYHSDDIIAEFSIGNCTNIELIKHDNYVTTTQRESHNYEKRLVLPATESQDGVILYTCKNCDMYYYEIIRPETTEQLVLEDSGHNVCEPTKLVVGYYFNGVEEWNAYSELMFRFDIVLTIVQKNEAGEYTVVEDAEVFYPMEFDYVNFTDIYAKTDEYVREFRGRYFTFDDNDVEELRNYLDENQYLAVIATNTEGSENVVVQTLVFE